MAHPLYSISLLNDLHNWFPDILYNPGRFRNVQDLLEYIQQVADVNPYTRGLQQYIAHQNQHHSRSYSQHQSTYHPPPATGSRRYPSAAGASASTSASASASNASVDSNGSSLSGRGGFPFEFGPRTPASTATLAPFTSIPLRTSVAERRTSVPTNRTMSETTYEYTATTNVNGNPVTARVRSLPVTTAILEMEEGDSYGDSMTSILQQLLSPNILRNFLDQTVEVAPTDAQLQQASTLYTAEQKEDDNCAICQDSMEEQQQLRRLNHCHHTFHRSCVDTWFRTNVHCPTCRHDIREHASHPPPPVPDNHRRTNIHEP